MEIQLVSFIKLAHGQKSEFIAKLKGIEEIVRIQSITGDFDILIEINVNASEELIPIFEEIEQVPGLSRMESHFVLEEWQK